MRKAFTADVDRGHTLVVADYGQLELRLLAHMANCASMLQAFRLGGDFHSRTALNMYEHIKAAVDEGAFDSHVPRMMSRPFFANQSPVYTSKRNGGMHVGLLGEENAAP